MRFLPLAAIVVLGGLSLATIATSETFQRGDRPTHLISADLGVSEEAFIHCFSNVQRDPNHAPSGVRQKMNKAVLLPCLQAENTAITNDLLDEVMDRYRPEGPIRG
ncbi:hypothetical protein N6L24_06620 [Cognatishimia sp. SS12]|uniref:hypothetical protein n=1 Tax=Cognatishimia sp. SS12 TaxID=2979465 RepID=UPI002330B5B8|nr:hypothetical protein [Cognatishimia sp. SS12]MDC0737945.1 hypothetical protein [Cognatishimia sp. SS12]